MSTVDLTRSPAPALPVPLTHFVGRARELSELIPLVGATRLLTLTGAGGSGKTRLALEAVAVRTGPPAELAWVELAGLMDPELVPGEVAATLGVNERHGVPMLDQLVSAIGTRRVLLVLDNCEHLIDAVASMVEHLLARCPGLSVVATSREALGVPGETAWLVPPLTADEAVDLFVERAGAAQAGFALREENAAAVREICRRLDGIPLAIEMAAARIRVLSVEQIATRLGDALQLLTGGSRTALPRHRTLRGTMEWSHALLTEREQLLFRRLGIFAGSCTLDAIEAVATDDALDLEEILDAVAGLVDKSLLLLEPDADIPRYRMLETVRQFASGQLTAAERAAAERRQAEFYVRAVEAVSPRLVGGASDPTAVTWLDREILNIRSVADRLAADGGDRDLLLRLGWAMRWYCFARGIFGEGRRRLEAAVGDRTATRPLYLTRALLALADIAIWQGDETAVAPLASEVMDRLDLEDDPPTRRYATMILGASRYLNGDPGAGVTILGGLGRELAADRVTCFSALVAYWLGRAQVAAGDQTGALESFQRAEQVGRAINNGPSIGYGLLMQGRLAFARGEHGVALPLLVEALGVHRALDDRWGVSQGLEVVGWVLAALGDAHAAAEAMGAAAALRDRIATPLLAVDQELHEATRVLLASQLGGDLADPWDTGGRKPWQQAVEDALTVVPVAAERSRADAVLIQHTGEQPVVGYRVRALGGFEVVRDGRLIPPSAWGSARARELFAMLLFHPHGLTKEQVGVAFWPEASSAQLRNSFHVTLHRLRRALGRVEDVVLAGDRYQLVTSGVLSVDAQRFESEVVAAVEAIRSPQAEAADADRLRAALSRYEGGLFEGEAFGGWVDSFRDRLQRLHGDGQRLLVAWCRRHGDHPGAAEAARQLLVHDPWSDWALQHLVMSLAAMGERATALRAYREFAERLERDLEVAPEPATTELVRTLQAGSEGHPLLP